MNNPETNRRRNVWKFQFNHSVKQVRYKPDTFKDGALQLATGFHPKNGATAATVLRSGWNDAVDTGSFDHLDPAQPVSVGQLEQAYLTGRLFMTNRNKAAA